MNTQIQPTRETSPRPRAGRRLDTLSPPVDIYETDEAWVIVADLPGVHDGTAEVTLEEDRLTVEGRIDSTLDSGHPEGFELVHREFHPGNFERSFRVGRGMQAEDATAKVHGGLLEVTLPKAAQSRPTKIAIST